jgi:4-amino-4-deoxy-L-arabinose transferase-like glycosyltransferase
MIVDRVTPSQPPLPAVLPPPPQPPRTSVEANSVTAPRVRSISRRMLVAAVAATLVVHVTTNVLTPYGLHRDELLYLGMGRHLSLWRMDFPPMIAILAQISALFLGTSINAVRAASTVAGVALLALTWLIARALDGRAGARAIAMLAVMCSPLFMRTTTLFQPVVLDQLCWTLGFLALIEIGNTMDPEQRATLGEGTAPAATARRGWLLLGLAGGLGLLTKFSIAFFAVSVLVALLVTPLRATLRTRWPWIAVAIALVIGSPSIVGQVRLGWPMFGQFNDLRASQLDRAGPLDFIVGQLLLGPAIVLAGYGLWFLLKDRTRTAWRVVGWTCVAAFVLLLLLRGKAYYLGPIYPTLFAAGAVALERRLMRQPVRRTRWMVRGAVMAALALYGLVTLPFGLPILAPNTMARYARALGGIGTTTNTGGRLAIPQDYADMLGWARQAATVAAVVDHLPADRRAEAVLLAANYGEAGALDFYGPRLHLPPVVSAAGSYWFFGPGDLPGATVIAVGIPPETLRRYFRTVTVMAHVQHENLHWVVEEERDVIVSLCEDPVRSLQDVWPDLKGRN